MAFFLLWDIKVNILRYIWLAAFYKIYYFMFSRRKQVIHVWNNMRVSEWWQNVNYPFNVVLRGKQVITFWLKITKTKIWFIWNNVHWWIVHNNTNLIVLSSTTKIEALCLAFTNSFCIILLIFHWVVDCIWAFSPSIQCLKCVLDAFNSIFSP